MHIPVDVLTCLAQEMYVTLIKHLRVPITTGLRLYSKQTNIVLRQGHSEHTRRGFQYRICLSEIIS